MSMPWYTINNIDQTDTPALVIYKDRIVHNIEKAIAAIKDVSYLRPHIKTNKMSMVCTLMRAKGITKFKCATIAEAEMLAMIGADDILLAYQPVGPKAERFFQLTKKYPSSTISCLVDDMNAALGLAAIFRNANKAANVYIDLNTGMNRTGIAIADAFTLIDKISENDHLFIQGIHAYDGHIIESDLKARQELSDKEFKSVSELLTYAENKVARKLAVVAGGSRTFATHVKRKVECSPGTFVFWDAGYHLQYPEEPYEYAALVITRVTSIVNDHLITTDLGYKSVASENPLPRVYFLNAPGAKPVSHSEEHLCIEVEDANAYTVGDVLYGVPVHICPTVALYDDAAVVEENNITTRWKVTARVRELTV